MHQKDVISIDISDENLLVTASIDNILCFWNNFTATEFKTIHLPKHFGQSELGQYIQCVRFMKQAYSQYLLIFLNSGNIYVYDVVN